MLGASRIVRVKRRLDIAAALLIVAAVLLIAAILVAAAILTAAILVAAILVTTILVAAILVATILVAAAILTAAILVAAILIAAILIAAILVAALILTFVAATLVFGVAILAVVTASLAAIPAALLLGSAGAAVGVTAAHGHILLKAAIVVACGKAGGQRWLVLKRSRGAAGRQQGMHMRPATSLLASRSACCATSRVPPAAQAPAPSPGGSYRHDT